MQTGLLNRPSNIVIPSWQPYDPWKGKDQILWLAELQKNNEKVIQAELLRCRNNLWHFLRAWALTENAHSATSSPFEPFPDDPHLYYLAQIWLREKRLLLPKSRQMTVTWLFIAISLWEALFFPSRLTFVQSKKEEDADATLERAQVMYDHLPKFMRDWQPISGGRKTFCHMKFKRNRSHLWAIPQGADHVRQYTATGYLIDEMAFQEEMEKVLAAAAPGLGPNGWIAGVSSAAPSYFQLLVFDKTSL
jgi:hypothetical protein